MNNERDLRSGGKSVIDRDYSPKLTRSFVRREVELWLAASWHGRYCNKTLLPHCSYDRSSNGFSLCLILASSSPLPESTMEVLRAGEATLRSSQLILHFLVPSANSIPRSYRTYSPIARQYQPSRLQCQPLRSFTTSRSYKQQSSEESSDAESKQHRASQAPAQELSSTPPSSRSSVDEDIASLLDGELDLKKSASSTQPSRTSRFSSPRAQANNPPSRGLAVEKEIGRPAARSSMDDLMNSLLTPMSESRRTNNASNPRDIRSKLDPMGNTRTRPSPPPVQVERPPMKLGPTLGRTVYVDPARGVDVGRAFRQMETMCARNKIRRDSIRQRFHERPGLKRKRLKSERWRRRFKEAFKETIHMVQKMKNQGW